MQEIHLAGHTRRRIGAHDLLIDDHGSAVLRARCGSCIERALRRFGPVPTLIEWDTRIPALDVIVRRGACLPTLSASKSHVAAA